jgi:hypothetical protein
MGKCQGKDLQESLNPLLCTTLLLVLYKVWLFHSWPPSPRDTQLERYPLRAIVLKKSIACKKKHLPASLEAHQNV